MLVEKGKKKVIESSRININIKGSNLKFFKALSDYFNALFHYILITSIIQQQK